MNDDTPIDMNGDNVPVFSVTEVSGLVKSTVEGAFQRVRIRGEISGFKRAASGHLYFAMKDDGALMDGVCWRGTAARLGMQPQDGMEVIATGRITTYPGRSKYQLVVETMELAERAHFSSSSKTESVHYQPKDYSTSPESNSFLICLMSSALSHRQRVPLFVTSCIVLMIDSHVMFWFGRFWFRVMGQQIKLHRLFVGLMRWKRVAMCPARIF